MSDSSTSSALDAEAHFQTLTKLLAMESKAESEKLRQDFQRISPQAAEASGSSLIQLAIRDESSGMGGRLLLTLGKRNQQQDLPWTRLRVGTPVQLSTENVESGSTPSGWRGVVSRLRRDSIEVALSQWPEDLYDGDAFRLDLAADEISRQRQEAALRKAAQAKGDRLAELRNVLLGHADPQLGELLAPEPLSTLNAEQWVAVQRGLAAEEVAIIHGPPGTGKTTTVVELIRQAVRRGETVLATAPSNLAVDNILERLLDAPELASGNQVIRIGHPARVLPQLRDNTLEELVESHPDMALARKLHKDAAAVRNQAGKWSRAKPERGARQEQRREAKAMVDDARRIERQLVERLLDGARILCATTSGLDERLLGQRYFDLCIIDEAAQSTEPGSWMPLLYCRRVVLAGDHCQLPPTIISQKAADQGLAVSLMERLMAMTSASAISQQLTKQYRMHQAIMDFSSDAFYHGTLEADEAVRAHLLTDTPAVTATELTETPVHFIDTAGADYTEEAEEDGKSRLNPAEAQLAQRKVDQLIEAGVAPSDIAIISPYSAQVRHLQEVLATQIEAGVEVNSIDGFQGREKEAIIISLVRSNSDGVIGFLADTRRMNVALTRARRKLIVIGDSATIGADPFYGQLLDYFDHIGAYHTVWEEM